MGWSGGSFTRTNGTYSGATVWAQDRDAGTLITASNHDTHDEDLADGIDACLNKHGSNSPSAHVQWIKSNYWGGTSGGSANAQTVTLSPAPTTYYAGMEIKFIPGNANTGACTLNVNSLGAKSIKTIEGEALSSGQLETSMIAHLLYNGTDFILTNPAITFSTWTPTYGSNGSMGFSSVTTSLAKYARVGKLVYFHLMAQGTTDTTGSTAISFTLPVTADSSVGASLICFPCAVRDANSGTDTEVGRAYIASTTEVHVWLGDGTAWSLGTNRLFRSSGFYEAA